MPNVVPEPAEALTVTVSAFVPAVAGVNVIVPVEQELPEAIVELAVHVPNPTVKSVESELLNGVAVKVTGPPDAVSVIEPVQVLEEPAFTAGHVMVPVAASAPLTPVPVRLTVVPVPTLVFTVTVSDFAPALEGTKLTQLVVQVAFSASARFAVQVPAETAKSEASEFENGLEDRVTGPPVAVSVMPAVSWPARPTPTLPNA